MTDEELLMALAVAHKGGDWSLCGEAAARIRALIAEHKEDQSVIAVWRGRAQRAEAEVERLRGLLRHAGVALWDTGVDHPVLQDIDDALPPGWAAQAREGTP